MRRIKRLPIRNKINLADPADLTGASDPGAGRPKAISRVPGESGRLVRADH